MQNGRVASLSRPLVLYSIWIVYINMQFMIYGWPTLQILFDYVHTMHNLCSSDSSVLHMSVYTLHKHTP